MTPASNSPQIGSSPALTVLSSANPSSDMSAPHMQLPFFALIQDYPPCVCGWRPIGLSGFPALGSAPTRHCEPVACSAECASASARSAFRSRFFSVSSQYSSHGYTLNFWSTEIKSAHTKLLMGDMLTI